MMDQHASNPRRSTVIQGGASAAPDAVPTPTKTLTLWRLQRPPLVEVTAWLDRHRVPYAVHNHGAQVRVAAMRLNYFVHTGTLYFEGEAAGRAEKGFAALAAALAPYLGPEGRKRSTSQMHRTRPPR